MTAGGYFSPRLALSKSIDVSYFKSYHKAQARSLPALPANHRAIGLRSPALVRSIMARFGYAAYCSTF
jgi:hypothetical protein